jgi:hypothetical protein
MLQHGASGFTSPLKESVLWIFITLKNPSPQPELNPRTLGPVASTNNYTTNVTTKLPYSEISQMPGHRGCP